MDNFYVEKLPIEGALLIQPNVNTDSRGFFVETYSQGKYQEILGGSYPFLQDNVILNKKGVARGLHVQDGRKQGKLVYCLMGSFHDILFDCRLESPTFGKTHIVSLMHYKYTQVWVPPGVAHGVVCTSEDALIAYKSTTLFGQYKEHTLKIDTVIDFWSLCYPSIQLSERDMSGVTLEQLMETLK